MGRFLGPNSAINIAKQGFFGVSPVAGGQTWTQLITGLEGPGPQYFSLDFANGNFLLGAAGTAVVSSPDAVTWSSHFVSGFGPPAGVAFGAGVYVVVLNNTPQPHIGSSPDLATWTIHLAGYPATSESLWKPVFGGGVFLTVSQSTARYATSPDGATWTLRSTYVPNRWFQPIYDGTRFVAPVLNGSNVPKIVTSTDGINWTEQVTLTAAFNGGSSPFFVGDNGTTQYIAGESTDDVGNNINGALTTATVISFSNPGVGTLVAPVFSGTSWARLNNGTASGISDLSSSPAGTLWTLDTVPAGFVTSVDLAFGLGKFLALGYDASNDLFMITRGP